MKLFRRDKTRNVTQPPEGLTDFMNEMEGRFPDAGYILLTFPIGEATDPNVSKFPVWISSNVDRDSIGLLLRRLLDTSTLHTTYNTTRTIQ